MTGPARVWADGPGGGTPINAARLNGMENDIVSASTQAIEAMNAQIVEPTSPLRTAMATEAGNATAILAAQTLSVDKLTENFYIPGLFAAGVFTQQPSVTSSPTIWSAPFDCVINDAWMTFDYLNVPMDTTNYMEIALRKRTPAGALTSIVTKSTKVDEAIVPHIPWLMSNATWPFPGVSNKFLKGDMMTLQFWLYGSTTMYFPMQITVKYSPS